MLIEGGQVTLSHVSVANNKALGYSGAAGADATGRTSKGNGAPGVDGTHGGNAEGGGIYLQGGTLAIVDSTVAQNTATGGKGGQGGAGFVGADKLTRGAAGYPAQLAAPAATVGTAGKGAMAGAARSSWSAGSS